MVFRWVPGVWRFPICGCRLVVGQLDNPIGGGVVNKHAGAQKLPTGTCALGGIRPGDRYLRCLSPPIDREAWRTPDSGRTALARGIQV